MFVSVCDRPSVAEPTETQDRAVMESRSRYDSPKNADPGTPTPHYEFCP